MSHLANSIVFTACDKYLSENNQLNFVCIIMPLFPTLYYDPRVQCFVRGARCYLRYLIPFTAWGHNPLISILCLNNHHSITEGVKLKIQVPSAFRRLWKFIYFADANSDKDDDDNSDDDDDDDGDDDDDDDDDDDNDDDDDAVACRLNL